MTESDRTTDLRGEATKQQGHAGDRDGMSYLRFGAMIASATVVMYGLTYVNTYALDHVRWSESRVFMALTMGGLMALVMLGWMLNMYRSRKANVAVVVASIILIAGAVALDRSQTTIRDKSFMSAMIPHHSIAILRAERAEIADVRVCELAVEIIEAQRREIAEMDWLIEDIRRKGLAATPAEAEERPVPEFEMASIRTCPPG